MRLNLLAPAVLLALAPLGCNPGDDDDSGSSTSSSSSSGGAPDAGAQPDAGKEPACATPAALPCEDQLIQQMNLKSNVAAGAVENTQQGALWLTHVDATAGATGGSIEPTQSYVYGKFTAQGLDKLQLSDDDALASMDWDIAFRRYVIRLNGGDSGPSCVAAARMPNGTIFDDVTEAPADLPYLGDEVMTGSCELIADGSGLPSSPATALSSYYTYPGCVRMTDKVFVIQTAANRHVKLVVNSYYSEENQTSCQNTETVSMPSGAAHFRFAWAFLD